MTYYEILEVSPTASQEVIVAAFRVKAKKVHPDTVADHRKTWAEEQFKLVNEAYWILSDPDTRAEYDQYLSEIVLPVDEQRDDSRPQSTTAPAHKSAPRNPSIKRGFIWVGIVLMAIVLRIYTQPPPPVPFTGDTVDEAIEAALEISDRPTPAIGIPDDWSLHETNGGIVAVPPEFIEQSMTWGTYFRASTASGILATEDTVMTDFDMDTLGRGDWISEPYAVTSVRMGDWEGKRYEFFYHTESEPNEYGWTFEDGEAAIVMVLLNKDNARFRYFSASTIRGSEVYFLDDFMKAADYYLELNS